MPISVSRPCCFPPGSRPTQSGARRLSSVKDGGPIYMPTAVSAPARLNERMTQSFSAPSSVRHMEFTVPSEIPDPDSALHTAKATLDAGMKEELTNLQSRLFKYMSLEARLSAETAS